MNDCTLLRLHACSQDLLLFANELTRLPAAWVLPAQLTNLSVAGNRLSGPLPEAWTFNTRCGCCSGVLVHNHSPALQVCHICSGANITPVHCYTRATHRTAQLHCRLKRLELYGNKLTGGIPISWVLPSLHVLDLADNLLRGTISADWALPDSLQVGDGPTGPRARLQGARHIGRSMTGHY